MQQLLDESEAELGFCKPWMMQAGIKAHGMQVAAARQVVARAVAQHPGKQRLPVALLHDDLDAMVHSWLPAIYDQPECSGCGRRSAQLRKCSRCRVAACELRGTPAGAAAGQLAAAAAGVLAWLCINCSARWCHSLQLHVKAFLCAPAIPADCSRDCQASLALFGWRVAGAWLAAVVLFTLLGPLELAEVWLGPSASAQL